MKVTLIPMPEDKAGRVESGIVQFGENDWPGVFMRGDDAMAHATILEVIAKRIEEKEVLEPLEALEAMHLRSLAKFLASSDVRLHDDPDCPGEAS